MFLQDRDVPLWLIVCDVDRQLTFDKLYEHTHFPLRLPLFFFSLRSCIFFLTIKVTHFYFLKSVEKSGRYKEVNKNHL